FPKILAFRQRLRLSPAFRCFVGLSEFPVRHIAILSLAGKVTTIELSDQGVSGQPSETRPSAKTPASGPWFDGSGDCRQRPLVLADSRDRQCVVCRHWRVAVDNRVQPFGHIAGNLEKLP